MSAEDWFGHPCCQACGSPVATPDEVITGLARYDDTQGGHNDRHTLVVEAAERALMTS